jgi:hypothetical protein
MRILLPPRLQLTSRNPLNLRLMRTLQHTSRIYLALNPIRIGIKLLLRSNSPIKHNPITILLLIQHIPQPLFSISRRQSQVLEGFVLAQFELI